MSALSQLEGSGLSSYLSDIKKIPTLDDDEEFELASQWKEKGDKRALNKIVGSHLKLVLKIAKGYSGYGLPLSDLIAEGNLGIMHAVQHFDPSIGYRFSTYAAWWIKAKIQEFVYNSWSIVRLSSTKNNRKAFFGLRKLKNSLGIQNSSDSDVQTIAEKMGVTKEDIYRAETRFTQQDFSINSPVGDEERSTWQDFLADTKSTPDKEILAKNEYEYRKKVLHAALNTLSKKEYDIVCMYRLHNPTKSLREIGEIMHLSAERVRQLEHRAFLKIQKYVKSISWESENKQA